jgi:hypothetical protein
MRRPLRCGLVGVGRADAALGGADLVALGAAASRPASSMRWYGHDHVGAVADEQAALDGKPARFHALDLLDQRHGIEHDAVADDAALASWKMPEGTRCSTNFSLADLHRVAGVVAALRSARPSRRARSARR